MKKITIITSKASWYLPYAKILSAKLCAQGFDCDVVFHVSHISTGDICFILSFDKILSSQDLSKNAHNIVCHASDLPEGKGWSPMTWQILAGASRIPVSMFEATERVDSGVIYDKGYVELDGGELIDELRKKLSNIIEGMVINFCNNTPYYLKIAYQQSGVETFYKKRKPEDSMIDMNATIADIFDLIRVADNDKYPVYFIKNGKKYIIKCEKE